MHLLPRVRGWGAEEPLPELRRRARGASAKAGRKARQAPGIDRARLQAGRLRGLTGEDRRELCSPANMNVLLLSILCGAGFGILAVALMLPMSFPDKRTALIAAFSSRFAIGFLIPLVVMPIPAFAKGALVGLLISLPDAIVTRAYAPVLIVGTVGGAIIGWLAGYAGA
jgi:hypothetical protein